MGKRGPAPKPTRLKVLAGNPGKRPLNVREPLPRRGRPKCPAWLDDFAKRKWRQLVPELDRLGLLTLVDGDVLAVYCQAWAEHRIATEILQREGRTTLAGSGGLRPHPAVAMQRSAWAYVKTFAALFGLDPSSRSRLSAPPPEEADPLEEFLRNG